MIRSDAIHFHRLILSLSCHQVLLNLGGIWWIRLGICLRNAFITVWMGSFIHRFSMKESWMESLFGNILGTIGKITFFERVKEALSHSLKLSESQKLKNHQFQGKTYVTLMLLLSEKPSLYASRYPTALKKRFSLEKISL